MATSDACIHYFKYCNFFCTFCYVSETYYKCQFSLDFVVNQFVLNLKKKVRYYLNKIVWKFLIFDTRTLISAEILRPAWLKFIFKIISSHFTGTFIHLYVSTFHLYIFSKICYTYGAFNFVKTVEFSFLTFFSIWNLSNFKWQ